jgi:LysM repeat protein
MKVFTIAKGVSPGATVSFINFKKANALDVPMIVIGEEGIGRKEGRVPVDMEAIDTDVDTKESKVFNCDLIKSKSGGPKFVKEKTECNDHCVIVMRTPIGFRGYSMYTGDRIGYVCDDETCNYSKEMPPLQELPMVCPNCGADRSLKAVMDKFPGVNIASGLTAGSTQYITVMPKDTVFRISIGSDNKKSGSTYYCFDGTNLNALSWQERRIIELF